MLKNGSLFVKGTQGRITHCSPRKKEEFPFIFQSNSNNPLLLNDMNLFIIMCVWVLSSLWTTRTVDKCHVKYNRHVMHVITRWWEMIMTILSAVDMIKLHGQRGSSTTSSMNVFTSRLLRCLKAKENVNCSLSKKHLVQLTIRCHYTLARGDSRL